jgi:hypothetical protein
MSSARLLSNKKAQVQRASRSLHSHSNQHRRESAHHGFVLVLPLVTG